MGQANVLTQIIFLSFCFVVGFCFYAFIFLCLSCLLSLVACCSKFGVLCCFLTLLFLLVVSHTCCFTLLLALSFHLVAMLYCITLLLYLIVSFCCHAILFCIEISFGPLLLHLACFSTLFFLSYLLFCTLILMDWYSFSEFFCASLGITNFKSMTYNLAFCMFKTK
jgi:hypothetical protein